MSDSLTLRELARAAEVLRKNNIPEDPPGYYTLRRGRGVELVSACLLQAMVLFVVFGAVPS